MYVNWQLCTLAGLLFGQLIPNAASWGLDFAMSVTFIGMIITYVKSSPMVVTVVVSGIVSLFAYSLPYQLGLIVAALAGIGYTNARLIGVIAAIAVGWFTQNLLLTIVVGMLVYFGWQELLAVLN